jgi:YbgC/YbaW family acyl-CoA thioester hydrolase
MNTFEYRSRVRFHDADPAGIAFFGRIFHFGHDAYEEFMRQAGMPLEQWIASDVGLPLTQASAEFVRPLKAGAEFTVQIELAELKPKGFTLNHRIVDFTGETCARLKTSHVAISRTEGRAIALPEPLSKFLTAFFEKAPHERST